MNLDLSAAEPREAHADLLGLLAHGDTVAEDPVFAALDGALGGALRQCAADERFAAKMGESVVIHTQGALPARRVALVGAGTEPRASSRPADLRHPAAHLARIAAAVGARTLAMVEATGDAARLESAALGLVLGGYRFDRYLGEERRKPRTLERITLLSRGTDAHAAAAVARGQRVATAVMRARDLVNEPAGVLTPSVLADRAAALATECGASISILGPDECRRRGMGLFLAVAQGSAEEPRFVHLAWRPPAGARARVVLVGKGVTFDSGGLSLKTTEGMLGMKADMAGAAAVLSATAAAAEENLPVEVHAVAACTENMPSGRAYKLGDVLSSMSGKTVEITNTDAEGRLTLGDALTFARGLMPDVVLDFATLTGACIVALGPHTAGVMTNDEALRTRWLEAARAAGEDMWPLPLPARLGEQLKSEIADMKNAGERGGGALIAGLFLREFVGSIPWVHVDIAGPATTDKEWGCFGKGGTGFGVASIIQYLRGLSAG
jgi:leucyl aminopeptidase